MVERGIDQRDEVQQQEPEQRHGIARIVEAEVEEQQVEMMHFLRRRKRRGEVAEFAHRVFDTDAGHQSAAPSVRPSVQKLISDMTITGPAKDRIAPRRSGLGLC